MVLGGVVLRLLSAQPLFGLSREASTSGSPKESSCSFLQLEDEGEQNTSRLQAFHVCVCMYMSVVHIHAYVHLACGG